MSRNIDKMSTTSRMGRDRVRIARPHLGDKDNVPHCRLTEARPVMGVPVEKITSPFPTQKN